MDVEAVPRSSNDERNARRFRDKYEKENELKTEIKEICDDAACVNVGQVGRLNVHPVRARASDDGSSTSNASAMDVLKTQVAQRDKRIKKLEAKLLVGQGQGTKPKGRKGGSQEGSLFESAVSHHGDDDDDSFGC